MKKKMESAMKNFFGWSQVSAKKVVVDPISYKSSNSGFTLVELIVICVILGILVLMALPVYSDIRLKSMNARVVAEIRGLEKDIIAYATDKGEYPANLNTIQRDNQLDPWGRPYQYLLGGGYIDTDGATPLNEDFDLYSLGLDGNTDVDLSLDDPNRSLDDIIRVLDGADVVLGSAR